MKKLITFILLAVAFLGGYYLGHKPGSPDIFALARESYPKARSSVNEAWGHVTGRGPRIARSAPPTKVIVDVYGKAHVLGDDEQ